MIPERPDVDDNERGTASLRPRYEDITQDGRLVVTAMMAGLGASAWSALNKAAIGALESFRQNGILPILSRLVLRGDDGPFSVNVPIHFDGCFRLAKETGGDRLFLNMWMDASAPTAHTFGPMPPRDAERKRAGRVFAEHVITRPFAAKGDRKVTRLEAPGFEAIPSAEHVYEPATALIEGLALEDAAEITFAMMHTDSNQHVNSMVYPKVFEETVMARTKDKNLLAREIEIRWRKPFFAGERAVIRLAMTGERTAIGSFTLAGEDPNKPNATLALTLG